MTRFGWTIIQPGDEPWVMTTNPNDLQAVYGALKALIPSAQITQPIDKRGNTVGAWLVAKFADLGWEPYAIEFSYYLRKAFD